MITDIFKKIITGLVPAFALGVIILIFLSDQVATDGGYELIPIFLLSPLIAIFLAWLIGHFIFKIQNITTRIVALVIIVVVLVGGAYMYGTNCNLQLIWGRHCNKLETPTTIYTNSSLPTVRFPSK